MDNLKLYKEFTSEQLNEGFITRTILALSIAFSSLFVNVQKAEAVVVVPVVVVAHSPDYPFDFKIVQNNYDEVMNILRGLSKHIDDANITDLLKEMDKLHDDLDGMGPKTFLIRLNVIKPKLVRIIEKYGTADYRIEQIYKHVTSKDFKRASVDFQYIKNEMDKISAKYKVTGWEKISREDVTKLIVVGIIGLIVVGFIFIGLYMSIDNKIDNLRYRREERRRQIERDLHALDVPAHRPMPPAHHIVHQPDPIIQAEERIKFHPLKVGCRIIYVNPDSKHNGKDGTFLRIREDGKYSVRFDDGVKLAASPDHVRYIDPEGEKHKKEDPYGEERWDN